MPRYLVATGNPGKASRIIGATSMTRVWRNFFVAEARLEPPVMARVLRQWWCLGWWRGAVKILRPVAVLDRTTRPIEWGMAYAKKAVEALPSGWWVKVVTRGHGSRLGPAMYQLVRHVLWELNVRTTGHSGARVMVLRLDVFPTEGAYIVAGSLHPRTWEFNHYVMAGRAQSLCAWGQRPQAPGA